MKKTIYLMLLYAFSSDVSATDRLSCSLRGTRVYSINGVFNNKDNASVMASKIEQYLDPTRVDEHSKVIVQQIFNPSHGLTFDALELLAQDLKARGITDDPWKYIGPALLQIRPNKISLGFAASRFALNLFTLAKLGEDLNKARYSVEQLQKADDAVVASVKQKVKSALDIREKVIVVAHSQGNSVTNLAMTNLKAEPKFGKEYSPYLGVLHVASPVNWRAIANSQSIKLSNDLIVSNFLILPFSESPNYIIEGFSELNAVGNVIPRILYTKGDIPHHGMVETYLNPDYRAYPVGAVGQSKNMVEIFNENMHNIALNLQDNCLTPNIKIKSALIEPPKENTNINLINTYAGTEVEFLIEDDNENKDENGNSFYDTSKTTFDWEIRKVGLEDVFPIINGSSSHLPLSLPYNDIIYEVKVIARNILGKEASAVFNFAVKNNRPPTLSVSGMACSSNNNYSDGTGTALVNVSDDSFALDNYKFSVAVPYKATDYPISITDNFGAIGNSTISNSCNKTPIHYEVWGMCQLGGPPGIDCYQNPRDPKCDQTWQTGGQFNELRIFIPGSTTYYTGLLSHGYEGGPSTEYFIDPNDPTLLISYPPGDLCSAGTQASDNPWIRIQ